MSSPRIANLEQELRNLRALLSMRQSELDQLNQSGQANGQDETPSPPITQLTPREVQRYSRQLIMPEIGRTGQLRLRNASVLICGTGGLGCAAALYLAGAGCGRIGLVDNDFVELNNLHRQLLHRESTVGAPKSQSGKAALLELNSDIRVDAHHLQLSAANALDLLRQYDVIVDASDNVPTRYLINDACVLLGRPLVSGSALRFEGQLTVYNHRGGPCYRCLFPVPPPAATVSNCGDAGVLGAVVGVIGTLQALQVVKILLGAAAESENDGSLSGALLLFDADRTEFRRIRLRGRNAAGCAVCGDRPTITQLIDYEQFCAARATDKSPDIQLLGPEQRIEVEDFRRIYERVVPLANEAPWRLIDVRTPTEFDIGHIDGAVNVPIDDILTKKVTCEELLVDDGSVVFVVCRRGNDSQRAVLKLSALDEELREADAKELERGANGELVDQLRRRKMFRDLVGGLTAWQRVVDPMFPIY